MAQIRRTRQQKIQIAQRRQSQIAKSPEQAVPVVDAQAISNAKQDMSNTFEMQTQATYAHVAQELRRITWVSLACLVLLAAATIYLSPMPWFQSIRQTLGLE